LRAWAPAHRGKWGHLTPSKTDEKLNSENMQKRAVFYVYVIFREQSGQAGVENGAMLTTFYYSAMLCIRGTSHGPVSVCPCLCLCLSQVGVLLKTAKHRITQTKLLDSPGTLVFVRQRSPRNSTGITPYGGTKCRWGGSKSATFHK